MTEEAYIRRIVHLAFVTDPSEMLEGLRYIGLNKSSCEGGVVTIDGAFRVGFGLLMDPPTKATQIAMALAGIYLTRVFPTLHAEVNKEWTNRTKELRKK